MGEDTKTGREGDPAIAGYRWTCPFCGASRLNTSEVGAGMENAVKALQTHVMASSDDEHGARNEFPPDFDSLDLAAYVVAVDGREDSTGARR